MWPWCPAAFPVQVGDYLVPMTMAGVEINTPGQRSISV
jgi:hypothetical protein